MELLTETEHEFLRQTGVLVELLGQVIGDEPSGDHDYTELAYHVHAVQNAVLAQAAARAYPNRYRLLGCEIDESL